MSKHSRFFRFTYFQCALDKTTDSGTLHLSLERPMKIEIVFDPAKQPLVNRVAAAAKPVAAAAATGGAAG